ncbi:SDR family oxidoreductase [Planctobacterium marinum]|uniref:Short-chain dehydrogenase n=1 Tax=Planctobacterium marinum TaxID=1631968 RepID=A0AA48HS10_9ALTE|nr:short-chain dehydrogenase [Planctobacterium marinum]
MQNVVITGANRGIGLELTRIYQQQGCRVWALCRQSSKELDETGVQVVTGVELSDLDALPGMIHPLQGVTIDLLIHNAGILRNESLNQINVSTIEQQFKVNAVAPLVLTDLLLDNLNSGAKVALVTSRMGSMGDNGSGGRYGYRMSKAALNAAAVSLAHDLKPRNISVTILHPGYVQTGMVDFRGEVSAQSSAQRLVQRIEALNLDNSGTFWHANGEVLPW